MTGLDDDELAWRRRRFRRLYDANHDDLWRYCLRRSVTTEEAEEALAETFSVAWRRLDAVPEEPGTRPWLFGVARNQLRSGRRRRRRSVELRDRLIDVVSRAPHAPDPADAVTDRSPVLLAALATLAERDQEILRLAAWEELPHAEIGSMLGCSENAVAIRVHRARNRLAKAVERVERTPRKRTERETNREQVKDPACSAQVGGNCPIPETGEEA